MSPGSFGQGTPRIRAELQAWARAGLLRESEVGAAEGIPGTGVGGQLIRPLVAIAGLATAGPPPGGFWAGVLAIQLAHEASLLHDDIVDAASSRRGERTLAASGGVARALLRGDHLLTAAYRAAARTGSLPFVSLFSRAVERTVAGEAEQGRVAGRVLDRSAYEAIVLGKSGELVGCALAVAPTLEGRSEAGELFELGRRFGLLYQMLDDLLDYCPSSDTGKQPLSDFGQRRWTWVLEEAPGLAFGGEPEQALELLHRSAPGGSVMQRALIRFESEANALRVTLRALVPRGWMLEAMIDEWENRARLAVTQESVRRRPPPRRLAERDASVVALLGQRVPSPDHVDRYLAVNSRSFRFASRLFPRAAQGKVARVYAFCRVTDDLVDRPVDGVPPEELLNAWLSRCRRAYAGGGSGIPLLDRLMAEMVEARVPFAYVEELVEGMRMDLRGERYATIAELRRYSYRVASVVGLWLTRLFGVHDPAVLSRAELLGHAMQFTNILRDVGEDWRRGRLYLPAELLLRNGVDQATLGRMVEGGEISDGYRAAMEELMALAETDYESALNALPDLPVGFARPVAVAAHVYRGIHDEIRHRRYDNLRHRAFTGPTTKGWLAARALWRLYRVSRPAALPVRPAVSLPLGPE
jgi:15-cis-phytoene synthase